MKEREAMTSRILSLKSAIVGAMLLAGPNLFAADCYVSPRGSDAAAGTKAAPSPRFEKARDAARSLAKPITIHLAGGTYYLPETLVLTAEDSGVDLAGRRRRNAGHQRRREARSEVGALQGRHPAGEGSGGAGHRGALRQRRAADPWPAIRTTTRRPGTSTASPRTPSARNGRRAGPIPAGGYIHAMHPALWGGVHWRITGKDADGEITYEGGWQNNRRRRDAPAVPLRREHLRGTRRARASGSSTRKTHTLYFYPPAGLDLATATVEAARLRHLVEFRGTPREAGPVRRAARA